MKAIIKYPDTITLEEALKKVLKVIEEGRVSETKRGKQFCFLTRFNNNPITKVIATLTKNKTDVFEIRTKRILVKDGGE